MPSPVELNVSFNVGDDPHITFVEIDCVHYPVITSLDPKVCLEQMNRLAEAIQHIAGEICGPNLLVSTSKSSRQWWWWSLALLSMKIKIQPREGFRCGCDLPTRIASTFHSMNWGERAKGDLPIHTPSSIDLVSARTMDPKVLAESLKRDTCTDPIAISESLERGNEQPNTGNIQNPPSSSPISTAPIDPSPTPTKQNQPSPVSESVSTTPIASSLTIPDLVKEPKLRNEAEEYIQRMELPTEQEQQVIRNCISKYASPQSLPDFLRQVLFRVINAVKSVFGKSDWQVAKRTIADRLLQAALEKLEISDPQDPIELSLRNELADSLLSAALLLHNRGQEEGVKLLNVKELLEFVRKDPTRASKKK